MGPKVKTMEVFPVAGYDSMTLTLSGCHSPYFTRNIVVLTDDAGHTGIGEIHGGEYTRQQLESYIPHVVGQPITDYRRVVNQLRHLNGKKADDTGEGIQGLDISQLKYVVQSETAVECALMDLLGKFLELPVAALLGDGIQRRDVEFLGYLFYIEDTHKTDLPYLQDDDDSDDWGKLRRLPAMTPKAIVKEAKAAQNRYGFKNFKLKGGVLDPELEMQTVKALHDAFPAAHINIDPNGAWSEATAIALVNKYKAAVTYMEDPCGPENGYSGRETLSEFKQATHVPVATNMIATDWRQFQHASALKSVDIVLADPHFWGLHGSIRMAQLLNDWGMTWGSHSNNHFDITLATYAQVAAAAPGHITPVDTHYIWQDGQGLLKQSPEIRDGHIHVSDAPGLGVEIDMDKLHAANDLYKKIDPMYYDRDDARSMQYLIPGWQYDSKKPALVR
ncbi:enolase C-terminal domain-like protein [Lacticaseibacillus baoqingensis]|uniref:glucarate dehydratase n=1 Tax=Lacticaseibacillus baoqingensis TaxID=2486013 RepID=A0ABW4E2B1_9LACO|nr:enolase C-terminal domain-like protein [Lacticaseibacillus baoqingensis]